MDARPHDSVPGLSTEASDSTAEVLADRLASLIDLQLTLKHVHWNVVGPSFFSVHEMMDRFTVSVREMTDTVAERLRTLGGIPRGTPGAVVAARSWEDYPLLTESPYVHLQQLDRVFDGIIEDHRKAIARSGEHDPVTEDLLIGQTGQLEEFQWFIRSFIERGRDTDHGDVSSATAAADRRDAGRQGSADRPPTESEARAAEESASWVDGERTAEHYEEMAEIGANARGEGRIEQ